MKLILLSCVNYDIMPVYGYFYGLPMAQTVKIVTINISR